MARCTASSASGLTAVDPFTTRETVDRETPAAAATSSIVTVPRIASVVMPSAPPSRMLRRHRCRQQVELPRSDDATVFPPAVLDGSFLGVVVDPDDAEPLLVPP